jgi:hypothetical protein
MKLSFPVSAIAALATITSVAAKDPSQLRGNKKGPSERELALRGIRIVGGVPASPNEFPSMAIPDYTGLLGFNINTCG